jgi:hypothetical protein
MALEAAALSLPYLILLVGLWVLPIHSSLLRAGIGVGGTGFIFVVLHGLPAIRARLARRRAKGARA